ncbi:MAG: substrate-binding domain-containing protein [Armatimonadetes bacterium]|nr:substrate-binding domain-containing protein [Armatimonadota bacterium]
MRAARLLIVLVATSLLVSGCLASRPRIGFMLGSLDHERYYRDLDAFRRTAAELDAELLFRSSERVPEDQLAAGRELLEAGVQVLVFQPLNFEVSQKLIAACREKEVPAVAYDRLLGDAPFDLYVTQDSLEVGRQQALYAVAATGGRGKYAILRGQDGHSVADEITAGNHEVLDKQPAVRLAAEVHLDRWLAEPAYEATLRLLEEHPDLRAVLCNNSAMARGVVQALQERKLAGKVYVAGADADLENCRYVAAGLQGMDVLKEIGPLGERAARAAVSLAQARPVKEDRLFQGIKTLVVPVRAFDKNSLEQVVIESGFHTRQAVFAEGPR